MFKNKLKMFSGWCCLVLIFVFTQMPNASPHNPDFLPDGSAFWLSTNTYAPAFFNFQKADEKSLQEGFKSNTFLVTKTWDGGGASENWSDAANWSGDTVPTTSDTVIFDGTSTKNATIDINVTIPNFQINTGYTGTISQSASNFTIGFNGSFSQSDGTYNSGTGIFSLGIGFNNTNSQNGGNFVCGGGAVNFDLGNFTQTGGAFDCSAASALTLTTFTLNLNGGSFNAPAAMMNCNACTFNRNGSTFNHSNGTITFNRDGNRNSAAINLDGAGAGFQNFFNLTFSIEDILGNGSGTVLIGLGDTINVLGDLNLVDGNVNSSGGDAAAVIQAEGNVFVSNTYGNGDTSATTGSALIKLVGSANRTITIPSDVSGLFNPLELDAANTTVNFSGTGATGISLFTLKAGSLNTGATNFFFGFTGASFTHTQSGGTFTCGSGNVTFGTEQNLETFFLQTGGLFDCSAASQINSNRNVRINLNGGVFDAPTSVMILGAFNFNVDGGTFNHNNGTVVFDPDTLTLNFAGAGAGVQDFFNVNFNSVTHSNRQVNLSANDTIRVLGDLTFTDGKVAGSSATIEAHGDVTFANTWDAIFSEPNLKFAGGNNQTYTNNGVPNLDGIWTINKTGGTVTAATSLNLLTEINRIQTLNITSGTLYLNENSNLTTGVLNVGTNGRLVNESSTTITLGGNVSNLGVIDLQGGGAGCPETDTILIRSTDATQRSWTGNGKYRLVDVDVQNMGGSGTKNVFSGTNTGGNNASWIFNANCPTALSITPSSVGVETGTTQTFTAGGGFAPYAFSIFTNNSGGSINPANGFYTAGMTAGVTDTVRVTDAFGATADAAVNVFGSPTKLGFTVQPSNSTAGQTISPAIQIAVQDQFGNTITNSSAAITVSIANNSNGGTLSGTLTKNAVGGIATFNDLSINRSGSGYSLQASSGVLSVATSVVFNINAGAASQLAFVVQPANTDGNATIAPPVQLAIQDALGNTVTTANDAITVGISSNPGGGTLSGTLMQNAVGGLAAFNNLSINNFGNGYTLSAASGILTPAASTAFDILNPFVVTNTNDSGAGSLRKAMSTANTIAGTDTISFNIPGAGPFIISPTTQLPTISDPIIIDGSTQPGFTGVPVIQINGTLVPSNSNLSGLRITAGNSTVRALSITDFQTNISGAAIRLQVSGGNTLQGNYLGITPDGTAGINRFGVSIETSNNLIGGNNAADRNIISGNTSAVSCRITCNNNIIRGNFIGTSPDGASVIGNINGINVDGNGNSISDNVISGNSLFGIAVNSVTGSLVENNKIGLNASGTTVLGNGGEGIFVVVSAKRVRLSGNRINGSGNGRLGIKLNRGLSSTPIDTPLPNDPKDPDANGVANDGQNYPVLTSAVTFGGSTLISGTFNSLPATNFTFEFFSSPTCGASGNGEGETFLGSTNITTGATGIAGFTANLPVSVPLGRVITATATDASGNTSEFSKCSSPVAAAVFSISGRVADITNNPIPNAVLRIAGSAEKAVTDGDGKYIFSNLAGGGNYTIVPTKKNHTFVPTSLTLNNLSSNQSNQNFTATELSTIKGQVVSSLTGKALPGITITLSGAANRVVKTDNNGTYSVADIPTGNYTVTPSRQNFTFTPSSLNFTLGGTTQIVNFNAQGTNAGGKIYFGDNNGDLSVISPDGSGKTVLNSDSFSRNRMDISNDGRKLTFFPIFNGDRLNIINSDGSNLVALNGISGATPTWSPDGSKIALINRNSRKIQTVNADGSNPTVIFTGTGNCQPDQDLDWSPDNTKIVFDSTAGQICSINPDGTNLTQLTNSGGEFPSISPDGTKIAYADGANVMVMNIDGSGQTLFFIAGNVSVQRIKWSPDGQFLAFRRINNAQQEVITININGTDLRTISTSDTLLTGFVWGKDVEVLTGAGANVNAAAGAVSVTFSNVTAPGTTTFEPIPPATAGILPGGYVIGTQAYEITTTATVSPPITVCFTVPATIAPTQTAFNLLSIMHNENGNLIDRTTSRNFAARSICATTTSLSPFALAQQIDPNAPRISGLILDSNSNPLSGVKVNLTGTETQTAQSLSDGSFSFVNLTMNGNYNVSPKQVGYLFTEYNQDFINLTDEQTVVFEGTTAEFGISGKVVDGNGNGISGIDVTLDGSDFSVTRTNPNGDYVFNNLPADGFYSLTPSGGSGSFDPLHITIGSLTGDFAGADFSQFAPTAAHVSVSGRVLNSMGSGINRARISVRNTTGTALTTQTNQFGYYRVEGIPAGEHYVFDIFSKEYQFTTRIITVINDIDELDFTAIP